MSVCTFFGHSACYDLDMSELNNAIEALIQEGIEEFLVGHQGQFDAMVRKCLRSLQIQYPNIRYRVVLAYLPTEKRQWEDMTDTMYPEGLENIHPKYAIEWRNRYLIDSAEVCLCYLNRTFGGAYKFARLARKRGLRVINLGGLEL